MIIQPPHGMKVISKQAFFYSTPMITSLAGSTNSIQQVNIQADGDFIIMKTMFYCQYNATPSTTNDNRPHPPVTVDVTDNGSGTRLTREPLMIGSFAGYGALPMIWNEPRVVSANSSIEVVFNNLGATQVDNLQLTFAGVRVQYGRA